MQGKHRNAIVGVRVVPRPRACGIVDGQQLNSLHAHIGPPAYHGVKVAKVANAHAALAAQREHRNDTPRSPPLGQAYARPFVLTHNRGIGAAWGGVDDAVAALLPLCVCRVFSVHQYIFILQALFKILTRQRQCPLVGVSALHDACLLWLPFPHVGRVAHNGPLHAIGWWQRVQQQQIRRGEQLKVHLFAAAWQHQALFKCRAVIVLPQARVGPGVAKAYLRAVVECKQPPGVGLDAQQCAVVSHYLVGISDVLALISHLQRGGPVRLVVALQRYI